MPRCTLRPCRARSIHGASVLVFVLGLAFAGLAREPSIAATTRPRPPTAGTSLRPKPPVATATPPTTVSRPNPVTIPRAVPTTRAVGPRVVPSRPIASRPSTLPPRSTKPSSSTNGPSPTNLPRSISVSYTPPVGGSVVDGWRPPANPYGAGNNGIDLGSRPGQPVSSVAAGVVTFAGQVGGKIWVVILHDDGVRTSLGVLADVTVGVGDVVAQGQVVGHAATSTVHFGARIGDTYIDPSLLLRRGSLRLIPTA
jgi:murein DD-endopeptidase MepM/ murein hydrolase activator NlpD